MAFAGSLCEKTIWPFEYSAIVLPGPTLARKILGSKGGFDFGVIQDFRYGFPSGRRSAKKYSILKSNATIRASRRLRGWSKLLTLAGNQFGTEGALSLAICDSKVGDSPRLTNPANDVAYITFLMRRPATNLEIQKWVVRRHGFVPETDWIVHCKQLFGIPAIVEPPSPKPPPANPCPPERQIAIKQAFAHFGMLIGSEHD